MYSIDEKAQDIRHMFEARLITRKEYGELIRKMEAEFKWLRHARTRDIFLKKSKTI